MNQLFWLRAETKKNEFRRPLDPSACQKLIQAGHTVVVEDWKDSIIPTSYYAEVGCKIEVAHSWIKAPENAIIVGLKALDSKPELYKHTHIYFAHVYKEQDGWETIMKKFTQGQGRILDLEFMVDDDGRRIAAFGYWAGYVGAALGALFSENELDKSISKLIEQKRFSHKQALINFVSGHRTEKQEHEAIVVGCLGRSGKGATDCLNDLGWNVTGWDKVDTAGGGPFSQLLNYKLFVNCVLAMEKVPPFINTDLLNSMESNLEIISDVSCDPDSDYNMIPLYKEATTLENPLHHIKLTSGKKLKITAIDNLPSILPKESSEDFSSQLLPYLLDFNLETGPLKNSLDWFYRVQANLD